MSGLERGHTKAPHTSARVPLDVYQGREWPTALAEVLLLGAPIPARFELLLGCGARRDRRIEIAGRRDFARLVTLDHNADHKPDIVHDLEKLPLPFVDDLFSEIHAYEVLEHTGRLGDWRFFFDQFADFWRILRPDGFLAATCPDYRSMWEFGDPSHTRSISSGTLAFLSQAEYRYQVDGEPRPDPDGGPPTVQRTPMSDFRFHYRADFRIIWAEEDGEALRFVLQAMKPSTVDSGKRAMPA